MSDVTILATGFGFPEGPVVCHDGSVVLTEIRHGRCTRVLPDGSTRVFSHTGGGPNGLAIGPDGAFYLCNNGGSRYVEGTSMGQGPHPDYQGGSIQRIDPHTGNPPRCLPPATVTRSRRRMTWCSMGMAASLALTSASALRVSVTMGGL